MFANCVHANIGILFTSEREIIFSPNCIKVAVEGNWNSKIFQNIRNLFFFGKVNGFFLEFFEIAICGKFFKDCVSKGNFSREYLSTTVLRFLWQKLEKIKVGKVGKYDEEAEYFEKKNIHPSKRHL